MAAGDFLIADWLIAQFSQVGHIVLVGNEVPVGYADDPMGGSPTGTVSLDVGDVWELAKERSSVCRKDMDRGCRSNFTIGIGATAPGKKPQDQCATDDFDRQEPMTRISRDAKAFIQTWDDVGELLDAATAEEQAFLLCHYVDVVELHSTDDKGKLALMRCGSFRRYALIGGSTGVRMSQMAARTIKTHAPKRVTGPDSLKEATPPC